MEYLVGNDFDLKNTCVTFGSFDGVHRGHQRVINKLLEVARQGLTSVVLSFEYDQALLGEQKILSTELEKRYLLQQYNPDVLISYIIDETNKDMPAEDFIREILVNKLGAKVIISGKDSSNITVLRQCAEKFGYELLECDTVYDDGEPVTSKRIVKELANGNLQKANELLGHPYLFVGTVMHGKALGRTVGMPTANISFHESKQLPVHGVYGTLSEIDGRKVKGLTNIGQRPSVDNFNYVTIEAFLLDFSGDLYDKTITLEIHAYIRGVMKFNNLAEVKAQVNRDQESIRAYFDNMRLPG